MNKTPNSWIIYFCIPQIRTKKAGRPASSVTKKSIGRLAKDRKGRKALGGDSTVTNQDQDQDDSSDEDDNPGDMDMTSDEEEEEEGESEIELGPTVETEQVGVGLAGDTQDPEAWKAGAMILCSDRKQEMERGIFRFSALFITLFIICVGASSLDSLTPALSRAEPASSSGKIGLDNKKTAGIRILPSSSSNPFSANPNNRLLLRQQESKPLIQGSSRRARKPI